MVRLSYLGEASSVDSEIKMPSERQKKLKSGVTPHEILLLVQNLSLYQGLGSTQKNTMLWFPLADVTDLAGQLAPVHLQN